MAEFSSRGVGNFAATFAQRSLAGQRIGFELRFNQLQNTLINRFNKQVDEINETPLGTQRKISSLQKKSKELVAALPVLQEYRGGNTNNKGQLEALFEEVSALFSTFNQDATVDADEVAAFEAQRDVVINRLNNIYIFSHPDINDTNTIQRLKENLDTLRGLEVTAGPLSGNQAVSDTLTKFQTEVSIGITVTQNTISTTLDMEQRIEAKFSATDADLIGLTTEEQARRDSEIEGLRVNLGYLLQAISISFEMNAAFAESLQTRLTDPRPQPGSVLNLFT
ncbi:MAG: hypothetical protein RIG67_08100 [Rhodospirillales bacterium]